MGTPSTTLTPAAFLHWPVSWKPLKKRESISTYVASSVRFVTSSSVAVLWSAWGPTTSSFPFRMLYVI